MYVGSKNPYVTFAPVTVTLESPREVIFLLALISAPMSEGGKDFFIHRIENGKKHLADLVRDDMQYLLWQALEAEALRQRFYVK